MASQDIKIINRNENRQQYRRLLKIAFVAVFLCVYGFLMWELWTRFYLWNMETIFYRRGNILLTFGYLVGIFHISNVYSAWKVGQIRPSSVAFGHFLSTIIMNMVMYASFVLLTKRIERVLPILGLTIIECIFAVAWSYICQRIYRRAYPPRRVLLVYGNRSIQGLERKIADRDDRFSIERKISILNGLDEIKSICEEYDGIIIGDIPSQDRNELLKYFYKKNIRSYLMPKISDILIRSCENQHMFDSPMLLSRNEGMTFEQKFAKRIMDIVFSGIILICVSPILLLVAVCIKLEDHGPVIYKQERLTLNGKKFYVLKFRSMRVDAEKDGIQRLASVGDSRITKVGKVIRALRIDEFPQLVNVLRGEMSLVGPRPERPEIAEEYEQIIPEFAFRLKVKAGLTGYAQVYGKYNTTPYDKLKLDLMYIQNYSLVMDLEILLQTIRVLFEKEATEGIEEGKENAL